MCYEREIQFERGDSAEAANDARIRAARERMRASGVGQVKSHTTNALRALGTV